MFTVSLAKLLVWARYSKEWRPEAPGFVTFDRENSATASFAKVRIVGKTHLKMRRSGDETVSMLPPHEQFTPESAPENPLITDPVAANLFGIAKLNPLTPTISRLRSLVTRTSMEPVAAVCPLFEKASWSGALLTVAMYEPFALVWEVKFTAYPVLARIVPPRFFISTETLRLLPV